MFLPDSRSSRPLPQDIQGLALGELTGVIYRCINAASTARAPTLAGLVLLVGFAAWAWRSTHPLIDLALFTDPNFAWGTVHATIANFKATATSRPAGEPSAETIPAAAEVDRNHNLARSRLTSTIPALTAPLRRRGTRKQRQAHRLAHQPPHDEYQQQLTATLTAGLFAAARLTDWPHR